MLKVRSAGAALDPLLQHLGVDLAGLTDRALGSVVTDSRSSWVRRVEADGETFFIKTYAYPSRAARWRGALRNTGPCRPSRAAREGEALRWLRQHGFGAPTCVGVVEQRRLGWLHWAVLVTANWPGEPVDRILATAPDARAGLVAALLAFVRALHAAGFRDRNLDLRNLLARRDDASGWQLCKLDSPRFRLRPAGRANDALARADWARLLPQLRELGCLPPDFSP